MRRRAHPSLPTLLVVAAIAALVGGLLLEVTLLHATHRARAGLERVLARAPRTPDHNDDALLGEATRLVARRDHAGASTLLETRTNDVATAATHELAARAFQAHGRFDETARHLAFAARVAPEDGALGTRAERAFDRALLARFRGPARVLILLSGGTLLVLLLKRLRRRAHARETARWLTGIRGSLAYVVDGRSGGMDESAYVDGGTSSLALDVFLHAPRGTRPPKPGPTLAIVLSHAASNTTLRLTPTRDVRTDALRVHVKAETLARIAARPGSWRTLVRLGSATLAESTIEVAPHRRPAKRGPRLLARRT